MRGIILGDYLDSSIVYRSDEKELNLYKRNSSENFYFYDTFFEVDFTLNYKNQIDSMGIVRFVDTSEIKNIIRYRKFNLKINLQKCSPKILLIDEIVGFEEIDDDLKISFRTGNINVDALVEDSKFKEYFKLNKELLSKHMVKKCNFVIAIKNAFGDLEILKIHSI